MDPFTEKLLERTRARRENLQKKIAERPTAANRPMAKRAREPLAETNNMISEPVIDKTPHPSSKPSPSKRRCSGENGQPVVGEENREPVSVCPVVSATTDPQTDRKPPVGPASVRSSTSLDRKAVPPTTAHEPETVVPQPPPAQTHVVRPAPEPQRMAASAAPVPQGSRDVDMTPSSPALQRTREEPMEAPTPTTSGMKSRLQRLAEQRHYWDADGTSEVVPDCASLSPVKTQREVAPAPVPTSSGPPLGRKGRLANLAATIGSWEDDLSHSTHKSQPETVLAQRDSAAITKPRYGGQLSNAASSKPKPSSNQPIYSPVKSNRVVLPSPQKTVVPEARPAVQTSRGLPSPVASPQKIYPSSQGRALPSSPQKVSPSVAPVAQSPLKNQAVSSGPNFSQSPQKPDLPNKPTPTVPSVVQSREKLAKETTTTPLQQKTPAGGPGVKSFLERFGERYQERTNQNSPAGGAAQARTPAMPLPVTPNTRLVQERLRGAQAASTATADLTQKQKLERESELAQIRNRFQKGNMWKSKDEAADPKKTTKIVEVLEQPEEVKSAEAQLEEATVPPAETLNSPASKSHVHAGTAVIPTPPASSPLKRVEFSLEKPVEDEAPEKQEDEVVVREIEMNVDHSINSAVINELFDGVLEDSDERTGEEEEEGEEEEDALNISSMSLLTPLVEASLVKSPERRMMTSTPASSFIEKSNTPESVSRQSKFQRARMLRAGLDTVEGSDEDLKLPYSIDAYRSTRVKETERPHVKQVIVRKEDVSLRPEDARSAGSHGNIKQRMKILTNDMNLQQTVIHQASQALNCCTDEEHGKGSQVEAEAERLLLVATERRGALKAELDRLKGEGPVGQRKGAPGPSKAQYDMGVPASKGSISLLELRLPLKADFVCSTANKPASASHYFFLMIRAGAENMVATPLASTRSALSGDALTFSTKFTMSDVSNDFEIDIEVYCLVQKRELHTDKKKKPSKSKDHVCVQMIWRQVHKSHELCISAITPKRFLAITKSSQTPVMASPGGPNAVRTSNFALVGSHKLTLASIGKNKYSLEKVPFLCPLEGHIYLKMQCEVGSKVEERGFLTMFEDVSGFGAWHRRWCVLSGYCISYWTYPDDERRKRPIGRINLANCTSKKVDPANREFCARPNTFELITVRPQREEDKETLVSQCKNTMCVTTNWLSADTKDERNLWMQKLNQVLVDLRMWQPDSCYSPA
ncbi:anillin isoform X2 [Osmerus eperlanus]|uniref:anillin isoform X2 n=1 Tax=Osmerus eperlanus TaxID=29151 RepID=UPI002E0F7B1B